MKIIVEGIGEKRLDSRMFVAKGGEGAIYVSQGVAYKICEPGKTIPESKIRELSALTDDRIIKPERMIYNEKQEPIGYTMRAVKAPWTPCHLFTREFLTDHQLTHKDIAGYSIKLREIVDHAHSKGMLLVDLNELNFLMDEAGSVFAIDVNSWQTKTFPATAIMDSIRDRHAKVFSAGTDWFSWAVVTFQMWIGMHPYKGNHPDFKGNVIERMDARMKANVSVFHDKARPLAATDSMDVIPAGLQAWYRAIFESDVREPPPQKFEQAKVTQPKTHTTIVPGDVVLTELMQCKADILRVFSQGDKMAVVLADRSIQMSGVTVTSSTPLDHLHFDRAEGWMGVTERGMLILKTIGGRKERHMANYERLFVGANGCLYGILSGKLMLIGPIGDIHVANVLDVPATIFQDDGVLLQNLLGRWHIVFMKSPLECPVLPIPEFDGFRPIKGRMCRRMLVVSGEMQGHMIRFEFQFDNDGRYEVRRFNDVSSPDFTFAVNEADVCALIDADDEVAAFRAKYGSVNRQVLANPSIDGSFRLWSCGEKILASRGKILYQVSKKQLAAVS